MSETTPGNDSKTFVLRLWSETARSRRTWRFSLEDPLSRGRRCFGSLRELVGFLSDLCRTDDDDDGSPEAAAPKLRRRVAALALAALLGCAEARAETPRLSLGQAAGAPGGAVVLPLVLASGDALPVGSLSLRVQVEPAPAAESVTFRRAGDWARRKAAFEARPQGDGGFSWILSLSEPAAASTDTLVGEVVVRLARGLPPGTQVTLLLDPAVSGFGDAAGTRFVSPGSGGLLLADGTVDVVTRIEPAQKR